LTAPLAPGEPPRLAFKPEVVYMCPTRRELFMVCDLNPTDMAELMIVSSHIAGQYAEMIPVVSGAEFGGVVSKAIPGAKKIVEG
jgi:hypothetical protein